jgi:hypothetical protein
VPPWALATLSFSHLSTALERTATYANRLLPNSGEIARQVVMSNLFKLPTGGGIKDSLALIYALDPASTQLKDEFAVVLPVADPKAVKTALVAAYGQPTESGGVLTFTLPQPLPQPDKTLVAKLAENRLLAAPDAATLAKLETFLAGKEDVFLIGNSAADASLVISAQNVKRTYGATASALLAVLGELAGPERARQYKAVSELLNKVWQIETLELRISLASDGSTGAIDLIASPQPGTPLAQQLGAPAGAVGADVLRLLLPQSAFFIAWNINGSAMAQSIRTEAGGPTVEPSPTLKASREAEKAAADLLELIGGDASLSVNALQEQSPALLLSLHTTEPAKVPARIRSFLEKAVTLLNADLLASALVNGKAARAKLKSDTTQHAGSKIETLHFELENVPEDLQASIEVFAGSPPAVSYAIIGETLVVASGAEGTDLLKQAILSGQKLLPAGEAAAALQPAATRQSQLLASITATHLARVIFGNIPTTPKINLMKLTRSLKNTPVTITGTTRGVLTLHAEVPVAAADAIGTIFQRLMAANVKFGEPEAPKGGSVPPPAP